MIKPSMNTHPINRYKPRRFHRSAFCTQAERNVIETNGDSSASLDVDLSKGRLTVYGLSVVGSTSITAMNFLGVIGSDVADKLWLHA